MQLVADRVKLLRETHLVLTQGELAERLGVARVSVNAWETGRSEPHPKRLRQMARLAGVDVRFFYEEQAA